MNLHSYECKFTHEVISIFKLIPFLLLKDPFAQQKYNFNSFMRVCNILESAKFRPVAELFTQVTQAE